MILEDIICLHDCDIFAKSDLHCTHQFINITLALQSLASCIPNIESISFISFNYFLKKNVCRVDEIDMKQRCAGVNPPDDHFCNDANKKTLNAVFHHRSEIARNTSAALIPQINFITAAKDAALVASLSNKLQY